MTCGTLEDSVLACRSSLAVFHEEAVIVSLGGNKETDMLLQKLPDLSSARIVHLPVPQLPELTLNGIYGELSMEKTEWKSFIKDRIKEILRYKPEAVFADNAMFSLYPIVHALRKKHIINCIYRYIHIAYLYRKKACLCEKKNLKWKDRG